MNNGILAIKEIDLHSTSCSLMSRHERLNINLFFCRHTKIKCEFGGANYEITRVRELVGTERYERNGRASEISSKIISNLWDQLRSRG